MKWSYEWTVAVDMGQKDRWILLSLIVSVKKISQSCFEMSIIERDCIQTNKSTYKVGGPEAAIVNIAKSRWVDRTVPSCTSSRRQHWPCLWCQSSKHESFRPNETTNKAWGPKHSMYSSESTQHPVMQSKYERSNGEKERANLFCQVHVLNSEKAGTETWHSSIMHHRRTRRWQDITEVGEGPCS